MESVPFHNDLAEGPDDVHAYWYRASDSVRLRVVYWPVEQAKGTIFLFSGRTEYAEKYGHIAQDVTQAGYALITMDWRGQGLSDRIAKDTRLGHVESFDDYQRDVAELLGAGQDLGCPEPFHMIAHSMGGCIGLRALIEGFPDEKVIFSAPMWGINLPAIARPLPYILPKIMGVFGLGERIAPGTSIENYVLDAPFAENMLTTDQAYYAYLGTHAQAVPEFALGGPTVDWVGYAAYETKRLGRLARPQNPVLTFLGSDEQIVSVPAIHNMHRNWPSAELRIVDGARHEIMMEQDMARSRFLTEGLAFLQADA